MSNDVLTIHYDGYRSSFDAKVSLTGSALANFARWKSISARPNNTLLPTLRIGDAVEIKVQGQWQQCWITKLDNQRQNGQSGQLMVSNGNGYSFWHHPDDLSVVRRFVVSAERQLRRNKTLRNETETSDEHIGGEAFCEQPIKIECVLKKESISEEVYGWSVDQVIEWFESIGFVLQMNSLREVFIDQNIDGRALLALNNADLKDIGFNELLHRKAILNELSNLKS